MKDGVGIGRWHSGWSMMLVYRCWSMCVGFFVIVGQELPWVDVRVLVVLSGVGTYLSVYTPGSYLMEEMKILR